MDKNQSDVLQNCKKKRMKNESGDKRNNFFKKVGLYLKIY